MLPIAASVQGSQAIAKSRDGCALYSFGLTASHMCEIHDAGDGSREIRTALGMTSNTGGTLIPVIRSFYLYAPKRHAMLGLIYLIEKCCRYPKFLICLYFHLFESFRRCCRNRSYVMTSGNLARFYVDIQLAPASIFVVCELW